MAAMIVMVRLLARRVLVSPRDHECAVITCSLSRRSAVG
jgi:hypothetical protein